MSDTGASEQNAGPGSLRSRLERLEQRLEEQAQSTGQRRSRFFFTGVALAVLSVTSLSWLTAVLIRLDAPALAQIGRLEVEKRLPQGREDLTNYLRASAPKVINDLVFTVLDHLPDLRARIVHDIDLQLAKVTADAEKQLTAQMEKSVAESQQRLELAFPELDDKQRIEKLVAEVSQSFVRGFDAAIDEIYPRYTAEMDKVQIFVRDLGTLDESRLTRKERTQKELIQTLLKIIVRENPGAKRG